MWRALRDQSIGQVRLVYAEMDEGLVHQMPYSRWRSATGAAWPWKDEFEVGTTIEHAGYVLTWLPAFFGSAITVTGFSDNLIADKGTVPPLDAISPDLAVAVIRFRSGVVARLTCSLIAPHNHSLQITADDGVLGVADTWYYTCPVTLHRYFNLRGRQLRQPLPRRLPPVRKGPKYSYRGTQQMDFARGVADLAEAVTTGRQPRLSARYSLHANELVLAVQNAGRAGRTYEMTTEAPAVDPMPWATEARRWTTRAVARLDRALSASRAW